MAINAVTLAGVTWEGVRRDGRPYLTTLQILKDKELADWYRRHEYCFEYFITADSDRIVFYPERYKE